MSGAIASMRTTRDVVGGLIPTWAWATFFLILAILFPYAAGSGSSGERSGGKDLWHADHPAEPRADRTQQRASVDEPGGFPRTRRRGEDADHRGRCLGGKPAQTFVAMRHSAPGHAPDPRGERHERDRPEHRVSTAGR